MRGSDDAIEGKCVISFIDITWVGVFRLSRIDTGSVHLQLAYDSHSSIPKSQEDITAQWRKCHPRSRAGTGRTNAIATTGSDQALANRTSTIWGLAPGWTHTLQFLMCKCLNWGIGLGCLQWRGLLVAGMQERQDRALDPTGSEDRVGAVGNKMIMRMDQVGS